MEKLTWNKSHGGYVAENAAHTRRHEIRRRNSAWELVIVRLNASGSASGETFYYQAPGGPESTQSHPRKWEAIIHANMWEAEQDGTQEDVDKLWDEFTNRVMGVMPGAE